MNKELEAFVRLEHSSKRYKGRKEDLDIVFTALKRLEEIDKAYQSLPIDFRKVIKALEIIKEKKVDIYLLTMTKNVDQYNEIFGEHLISLCRLLTQEEFDLLKEVLK